MSEINPELDTGLRRKLLALGEQVSAPFDSQAEARMVEALTREAERLARRTRRERTWIAASVVLAAAAVLLVWLGRGARPESAQVAQVPARIWAGASLVFEARADGSQLLSLGRAGRIVLAAGGRARVTEEPDGVLRVELAEGQLAAELQDLRPGSLRVRTQFGDVLVKGTTFSVDVRQGLEVVLLSGAVEFTRVKAGGSAREQNKAERALAMAPGKTLRVRKARAAAEVSALSAEEAQAVNRLLGEASRGYGTTPPVVAAPATAAAIEASAAERNGGRVDATGSAREPNTDPTGLLARAEAARRAGDLSDARDLYKRAARVSGADAEVALLRHVGFELDQGERAAAQALLQQHQRRFARSHFAAEAAWLEIRALQLTGDQTQAKTRAAQLVARFPGSPQAQAAQRLLDSP